MNVCLFLPNWIGDAVMATPAIRAVRHQMGPGRLIGVLRPYIEGVVDGLAWFDRQIRLNPVGRRRERWPAVVSALRQEKIDIAILFPNSFHAAWVAWWGNCRKRIGYARYGRAPLLTDRLDPLRDSRGKLIPSPCLDAYIRLVECVGWAVPSKKMELATTSADEETADRVWKRTGLGRYPEVICLNPGAAFGSAKYWPARYFGELAASIRDERGSGVLVLCGPREINLAHRIVNLADRPGVVSLASERLSIGLTKACIRRCDLLVTTDSGPRHFAAAFGRPVITLFGPTHIPWTETYFDRAIHLQKQVDCGPCQRRTCPLDHRCMRDLRPSEVFAAIEKLLMPKAPAARAS
jgi:lipopolysaccharide heptosyltransferase II